MKLYSDKDVINLNMSQELCFEYLQNGQVLAQESITDYLYKIKDVFSNLFTTTSDKITMDAIGNKYEMLNIISKLKFIDIKDVITDKPENFIGKYTDYSLDLLNASEKIVNDTNVTLSSLKIAISVFLNEYTTNKVINNHGYSHFKETEKLLNNIKKDISKYFPRATSKGKAKIGDLLRNTSDIEALFKNIEKLDNTINQSKLQYINKLSKEAEDLIDSLIQQNMTTKILTNNDNVKKELFYIINTSASEIELLHYVYSNVIMFYSAFIHLNQDIKSVYDNK